MIKLFDHYVHPESIERVVNILESGWTGLGKEVELFERKFAEYIGGPTGSHVAVAFNSGTAALDAAVASEYWRERGMVISTPNTFVSTNHVLLQHGFKVAFADIDINTGLIDLESVKRLLKYFKFMTNEKVAGLMVVHYGGMPVDLDQLYKIADEERLFVIEDCAHACGARYKGYHIGEYPKTQMAAFSFHSVKNLALGDGGALVVPSSETEKIEFLRKYRWLGIDKSTGDRSVDGKYSWQYEVDFVGQKSHMNNINAALGVGQLANLDKDNEYRKLLFNTYDEELGSLMIGDDYGAYESSHHLASALFPSYGMRNKVMQYLATSDIHTGVHYLPNHLYDPYEASICENECFFSEYFADRELSLPLHLRLTVEQVREICKLIREAIKC